MKSSKNNKNLILVHLLILAVLVYIVQSKPQYFCLTPNTNTSSPTPEIQSILPGPRVSAKVTRVIDGDTFVISTGERVRLIGIDTPEMKTNRGTPDCFAKEAKDKLTELLSSQSVQLEMDASKTDRYGRLLRYVYKDDVMINEQLLKEGYASVFTFPPDVKYADQFLIAEKLARKSKAGLWSKCGQ